MNRLRIGAVLAILFAASTAGARSVEEVLKEKGIITESEFTEIGRTRAAGYVPGSGFTATSSDGLFRLAIGGRIQVRYTFTDKDDVGGPAQDVSDFRFQRVKLILSGHAYTPNLTYRIQAAFENGGNAKLLDDGYVGYRFRDEARLQAGQFKVPFSRQEITSDGALQFVDRSIAVNAFKPSYDMGTMLEGSFGRGFFNYHGGVFGGTGQSNPRTNNAAALALRAVLNPFGELKYAEADVENTQRARLSIGADWFRNTLKKTAASTFENFSSTVGPSYAGSSGWLGKGAAVFDNTEKVDLDSYSLDAAFKWAGFSFQAEYLAGEAKGQTTGRKLKARGLYAQAGCFVLPKRVEIAARYSYLDPRRDAINDHQAEVQGAVSYYFAGHGAKLQADYTNSHTQKGAGKPATDDRQIRLQAQVAF